ncbi:UvrD-helicase domain-containing protein [Chelativorans sp. YIM 93263]|uniref:UvrD-helicase domain-containing protein n=1 Tax=Chelativorans sp. YIM 93263 TaxID=2906648 RepID=UPI002377EC8C|nr:UvrD-helicase domain-containing protein [Chelativorans sp. YIM 93263]
MDETEILNSDRISITAPAGCGKTHLIAACLRASADKKPSLVLTHTNAGVAALRSRLDAAGVARTRYRITTIDGWALRLVGTFPGRSGQSPSILALKNPGFDYPAIRAGALSIIDGRHVQDVLEATYSRVIVDEYQDCIIQQHGMIMRLSEVLPTCVLGDAMQAIFGWGRNVLVDWTKEVEATYPPFGRLDTPWRWDNSGCSTLGKWLLWARGALQTGAPIDLRNAPEEVTWVQVSGPDDVQALTRAAYTASPVAGGGALIVCDSRLPRRHREIASRVKDAVVVENADLSDFIRFAEQFNFAAPTAADDLIDFAASTLTGVGAAQLKQRLKILLAGRAQKAPNDVEQAAVAFARNPVPNSAVELLVEINRQSGVAPLRPSILRACIQALNGCVSPIEFYEMAVRTREQSRVLGRTIPRRAVGSTLLLKGLEADVSIVLDTESLDARNLYVAMTRGSRRLVICSTSPVITRQI